MSYTSFRGFFVLNASRGVKWTPGWLPQKGEILPVSEWIIALDDFKTRELAKAWRCLWSWLIVGWLILFTPHWRGCGNGGVQGVRA